MLREKIAKLTQQLEDSREECVVLQKKLRDAELAASVQQARHPPQNILSSPLFKQLFLLFVLAAFVIVQIVQTELSSVLQNDLNYNKPVFIVFLCHSGPMLILAIVFGKHAW
jgi:hypothetical protein